MVQNACQSQVRHAQCTREQTFEGAEMARPPTKVALGADGLVPAFEAVTLVMADPCPALLAMGVGGAVNSFGCWILFRHPYLEIHKTVREGSRTRYWRAGVDRHSQQKGCGKNPATLISSVVLFEITR
jgi:hypothetical protein